MLLGAGYFLASVVIAVYSASFFILIYIYLTHRGRAPLAVNVPDDDLLSVTLQVPVYNERFVIARLVDALGALDYPSEKLVIQVIDDSTDETSAIVARKIAEWRGRGLQIDHIRRTDRTGYKAGALAYGLALVTTDCVGVFDADFIPAPEFLRRVMPHFNADPKVALVQTRWAHLNVDYNLLTRAQTLALDQHFAVEQVARSRGDLPMSMNGTGGVWRCEVIRAVGGWSADTLTEDLDLSYRAFLKGWRFRYVVDVPVPGEIPPQLTAYKVQQARWAKGVTQCFRKHVVSVLRSDLTPLQKTMGAFHLAQYLVQPFVLAVFLLTPPVLLLGLLPELPLGPLGIAGLAPLLFVMMGQVALYQDWPRRLVYFPVLLLLGTGMMLSNSRAVIEGLTGWGDPSFKRTPKFRVVQRTDRIGASLYVVRPDWTTIGELILAAYALVGLVIALVKFPMMTAYMLMYVVAFGLLAYWGLRQGR